MIINEQFFFIVEKSHYIKYDMLKKPSWNNNVCDTYLRNLKTVLALRSVGILWWGL